MNDLRLISHKSSPTVAQMSSLPHTSTTKTAQTTTINSSKTDALDAKTDFKKKKQANLLPTIRFEIKLEKPSSDQFCEYNYNKLVVKTLKMVKKKSKKVIPSNDLDATLKKKAITTVNKNDLSILDDEFRLERDKIKDLLSTFRKKIILSNENILLDDENGVNQSDLNAESNTAQSIADSLSNDSCTVRKKTKKKPKKSIYDLDNNKYKLKNFEHLGKGYDEEDSFIDNSEAIEEESANESNDSVKLKDDGIEIISSTTNSNSAHSGLNNKKRSKRTRRVVNDDDEEDDEIIVDEEQIKENIENRNKLKQPPMANISQTPNQNHHMQQMNKKKRKTDSSTTSADIATDSQIPSKLIRTNEDDLATKQLLIKQQQQKKINELKQSNQTNNSKMIENQILNDKKLLHNGTTSSLKTKNESESEEIINIIDTDNENNSNSNHKTKPIDLSTKTETIKTQIELPATVTANLRDLINKFINLYFQNSSHLQNVWTDDLKNILFKIYKDSQAVLTQNDRSSLFNYISVKTNKSKDSLMRHCRKLLNKEQSTAQQSPQQPQQQQPKQKLPETNSSFTKSPGQQQMNSITMSDLDDSMRSNLLTLEKEYQLFKQRNDPSKEKFFELKKIATLIWTVDTTLRQNITNNATNKVLQKKCFDIKNFSIDFMSKSFELQRPQFIRILNQILTNQREILIKEKMNLLKKAIDDEMPKQQAKFKITYDEYLRHKSLVEASNVDANEKKKLNAPRKRFEWNHEIRDLYLTICSMKMELFRKSPPPVNEEEESNRKNDYLKMFLVNNVLNLWPDNWMQLNVLIITQIKGTNTTSMNSNRQQQSENNQQLNTSSIINIASKNGKQIKLEHQPLEQACLPPSNNNPFSNQSTQQKPHNQQQRLISPIVNNNQTSPPTTTSKLNIQTKEQKIQQQSQQSPQSIKQYSNNMLQNKTNPNANSPRPSSSSSNTLKQPIVSNQTNISPTNKQNVYDNVVNQYKFKGPATSNSNSTTQVTINSTTSNYIDKILSTNNVSPSPNTNRNPIKTSNKSPTSIRSQQLEQQLMISYQQQIALQQMLQLPNGADLTKKFEQQQQAMFSSLLNAVSSSPNLNSSNNNNNTNKTNFSTNSS